MTDDGVTQMSRVQQMLLAGPVCATTFLANYMSAARSRVSELRTKHGWSIETVDCDLGHNHKTRQIMYRLTHDTLCCCPRCQVKWSAIVANSHAFDAWRDVANAGEQMVLA